MYDFKKDGAKYTIEQSEGEVSITKGEKLSYNDVVNAFGGEKERERYGKTVSSRKNYKRKALLYMCLLYHHISAGSHELSHIHACRRRYENEDRTEQ